MREAQKKHPSVLFVVLRVSIIMNFIRSDPIFLDGWIQIFLGGPDPDHNPDPQHCLSLIKDH